MKRSHLLLRLSVCAGLLLSACTDDTGIEPGGDTGSGKVTVIDVQASECYGFVTTKRITDSEVEQLLWSYDPETQTLELQHTALMLNCCGLRTVDALYDNGVVTMQENDQPEPGGGRCRCTCPFDFMVILEGVTEQVLGVRIELTVDEGTTDYWAGTIDLSGLEGSVVIDSQTARVIDARPSACHGFDSEKPAIDEEPEQLLWSYTSATGLLELHHAALILNCCGVHTVNTSYVDGVVVIRENDQPDPDGGRCDCICPFDFAVTLAGIPEQVLGVRIELTVDTTTNEHWAGAIDLSTGSGSVTIDTNSS